MALQFNPFTGTFDIVGGSGQGVEVEMVIVFCDNNGCTLDADILLGSDYALLGGIEDC